MTATMLTTDCHFPPPPQLADELPERLREHVPHLEELSDGVYLVRPMAGAREMIEAQHIADALPLILGNREKHI